MQQGHNPEYKPLPDHIYAPEPVETTPDNENPPNVNTPDPQPTAPSTPKPNPEPTQTVTPDDQGSPPEEPGQGGNDDDQLPNVEKPEIPPISDDDGNGGDVWDGNQDKGSSECSGDFIEDNKELIKKVKNILDFVYPDSGIDLAKLLASGMEYICGKAGGEGEDGEGEGGEDKPIDIDSIKDLTVDEIKEMNSDDEYFEIEINEYGYINTIYGKFSDVSIKSSNDALYSLLSVKTAIGINDPFEELRAYSINKDETGTIFKFTQFVNGVPCFDNKIVIACDTDGTSNYLMSSYFPVNATISTSPQISYNDINNAILKEYPEASIIDVEEDKRLYVLNYYGKVYLVWNKYIGLNDNIYQMLVESNTGKILYKNASVMSLFDEELTVTQNDLLGKSREISIVKKSDGKNYLEDRERNIFIYNAKRDYHDHLAEYEKTSVPEAYSENTQCSPEAVSAMANMKEIYDFYKNIFDRISFDDAVFQFTGDDIKVYINTNYPNNAFWAPSIQSFIIGEGDGARFKNISFAASRDILCHEFTHAVVEMETSLAYAYFGTAGAINEAYADIMACLFTESWTIGEDIALDSKGNLRNIESPHDSGYGSSPLYVGDNGGGYVDYKNSTSDRGGVHYNSTIISHCAYLMSQDLTTGGPIYKKKLKGLSKDKLKRLWYKSLCLDYSTRSDFWTVYLKVTKAARILKFTKEEMETIIAAFKAVGITAHCSEQNTGYFEDADRTILILRNNGNNNGNNNSSI